MKLNMEQDRHSKCDEIITFDRKSIVAIDVDQTLYDFDNEIREAFFELALENDDKTLLRGAYSTNVEWRNLTDVLGTDIAIEAINRVHDKTLSMIPFLKAADVCYKLSKKYEIRYVTSRLNCYQAVTEDWLYYNNFPDGEVICSTHEKMPHVKDCRYLIDDRPKTIIEFVTDSWWGMSRQAFGLWTPYNRNLTDIKNVYLAPTWKGIQFYLERKGLI
jgi:5'(3')-deoxyribonucleotidase